MISSNEKNVEFLSMAELQKEASEVNFYKDLLDSINTFTCGNYVIDNFIRMHAIDKRVELDTAKTKLLFDLENKSLIGFYSISAECLLSIDQYSNKPKFEGPAIRINMFAVDRKYQKLKEVTDREGNLHTWASSLFDICLRDIQQIAIEDLAACFIILSATDMAHDMYKEVFEFTELDDDYVLASSDENDNCIDMYRTIFEY